jgi:WD40 repeat protein
VAIFSDTFGIADLETGRVEQSFKPDAGYGFFTPGSWRPDGQRFALGTSDGSVTVLDGEERVVAKARVAGAMVSGLDYTPDGARIAVSAIDGTIGLVDAETLAAIGHPMQVPGYAALVTLAPDGRRAFVATTLSTFRPGENATFDDWAVVDLVSGKQLTAGHLPEVTAQAADFSPDGTHVALGFGSGRMELLDTATGVFETAGAPSFHAGGQGWVTYTPDGTEVLTSDGGANIGIWDASTGRLESSVRIDGAPLASAQLRAGTSEVWILGLGGSGVAWDPRLNRAIAYACVMAGRDMTAAEWATYVGDADQQQVCPP